MLFGKSDLFFICALTPKPGQFELVRQEREIAAVKWMPLQEFGEYSFYR